MKGRKLAPLVWLIASASSAGTVDSTAGPQIELAALPQHYQVNGQPFETARDAVDRALALIAEKPGTEIMLAACAPTQHNRVEDVMALLRGKIAEMEFTVINEEDLRCPSIPASKGMQPLTTSDTANGVNR